MALAALGITKTIGNIDATSENSLEARQCRLWYDPSRLFLLADFDWNFSRRWIPLAKTNFAPPSQLYVYGYGYPSNCVKAWAIVPPGVRAPNPAQRIPFEVAGETGTQGDRKVIYTDQIDAVLKFSANIEDTGQFDANFVLTFVYLLATNAGMALSINPKIVAQAMANYRAMKDTSVANTLVEGREDLVPMGETELSRG